MKQTWGPELWLLSPTAASTSYSIKMCDLKAGCLTKTKNGAFLTPEIPDQRLLYEGLKKQRGMGWGGCVGSVIFFFLQTLSQSFSYRFLALHVPKTVSPPPKDSCFLCLGPLCAAESRPSIRRSGRAKPPTPHPPGGICPLPLLRTRTALLPGHWKDRLPPDTEKVAPLWRIPLELPQILSVRREPTRR